MEAVHAFEAAKALFKETGARNPVLEDIIGTDAEWAYAYAKFILKQRWADIGRQDVEDLISKDVYIAAWYAFEVIKGRWADIGRQDVEDWMLQSEFAGKYNEHFAQQGEVK